MAEGRSAAGIDPQDLLDYALVGTEYIAKGFEEVGAWSKKMVDEFGDRIKPYLQDIFEQAKANRDKFVAAEPTSVAGIWKRAKDYLDAGETNYDDIRAKIATDLGIPIEEVTKKLAAPKAMRRLTDEMYVKMQERRRMVENAKNWVRDQQTPGWRKFARFMPRAFFKLYTFGHGTVGMVTHAALNIFDPRVWSDYWPNFLRQFKLLGFHDQGAYHEMMMQNLVRDPNYVTARRAGLANDPFKFTDEYQKAWDHSWLAKMGLTGNRGFDALKLFRQDYFNREWESYSPEMRTPDNAKLLADSVNHATGALRTRFPEWSNWTFFAPKLEGSRWAWMLADPAKAADIFRRWETATDGEKQFALRELKQKAAITGTYLSLLALNQGMLTASGSDQKINFTDPKKGDFLSFKVAGHNIGVVGPMLGIVRLFVNMLHASMGTRTPYEKRESRSDQMASVAKDYVRGKLSPIAGVTTDIATQTDFQKRPLPFSNERVPAYLRRQGEGKYTYAEYAGEHLTPIPVSEAVREVWARQGMDESTIGHWLRALTSAGIMGSTGARVSLDTHKSKSGAAAIINAESATPSVEPEQP